jgi:hypothetical protein
MHCEQSLRGKVAGQVEKLKYRPARDRRPVFFTVIPDYEGINAKRNRDWKSTFDRR